MSHPITTAHRRVHLRRLPALPVLVAATALSACGGGGDGGGAPPAADDKNAYIQSVTDQLRQVDDYLNVIAPGTPQTDGDYICTTQTVDQSQVVSRFFMANSDAVWPGALLQGQFLESGSFQPISVPRGPMTISISGPGFGTVAQHVASPVLSTARQAVNTILESHYEDSATPAQFDFKVFSANSTEQLQVALSAAAGNLAGEVQAGFSSSQTNIRSTLVARFRQVYFTIDMDTPTTPASMFADSVSVDDLRSQMGTRNPPVYVGSMAYGRVAYFMVESKFSSEEVSAALEATANGDLYSAKVNSAVSVGRILDESAMTVIVYGGAAATGVKAINGYTDFKNYIFSGANFSKDSPAVPISFTTRYLSNNADASISVPASYSERHCQRWNQRLRAQLTRIRVEGTDAGNNMEVYSVLGRVHRLPAQTSGDYFTFASRGQSDAISVTIGSLSDSLTAYPGRSTSSLSNTSLDFSFPVATYKQIRIYASPWELDESTGNDRFGSGYTANLNYPADLDKEVKLQLTSSSGDAIELTYKLTPLTN